MHKTLVGLNIVGLSFNKTLLYQSAHLQKIPQTYCLSIKHALLIPKLSLYVEYISEYIKFSFDFFEPFS